jgi:beta-lactamase class A
MLVAMLCLGMLTLAAFSISRHGHFFGILRSRASVSAAGGSGRQARTKKASAKSSPELPSNWYSEASASISRAAKKASAKSIIDSVISKYPGISTSVSLTDLSSGATVNSGVRAAFTAASTTKVITAACFLNLVEQGKASLDTSVNGSRARSQIRQMINQSDNNAWHALKSWVGYDNVEAYAHRIGLSSFDIYSNTITTSDDALLLQKLYQRQLLNESNTALLLSFMQNTNNEDLIPAALPADATIYHKYGLLYYNLHDTSIIKYDGEVFVLVIFTNSNDSSSYQHNVTLIHEITQTALALY